MDDHSFIKTFKCVLFCFVCLNFCEMTMDGWMDVQAGFAWLWRDALSSLFYHEQNLHLVVNVAWGLFTCTRLERQSGNRKFLLTTILMIFLCRFFTIIINYLAISDDRDDDLLPFRSSHNLFMFRSGFSGLLFSLHFLLVIPSHEYHLFMSNLHIGHHHAHLLLAGALIVTAAFQAFILPNACFSDNLGGIMAGFCYSKAQPHVGVIADYILSIPRKLFIWFGFASSFPSNNFLPQRRADSPHIYDQSACDTTNIIDREDRPNNPMNHDNGDVGDLQQSSIAREPIYSRATSHNQIDLDAPPTNHYEYRTNHGNGDIGEERELNNQLEWKCSSCNKINGVFYQVCEDCETPRQDD